MRVTSRRSWISRFIRLTGAVIASAALRVAAVTLAEHVRVEHDRRSAGCAGRGRRRRARRRAPGSRAGRPAYSRAFSIASAARCASSCASRRSGGPYRRDAPKNERDRAEQLAVRDERHGDDDLGSERRAALPGARRSGRTTRASRRSCARSSSDSPDVASADLVRYGRTDRVGHLHEPVGDPGLCRIAAHRLERRALTVSDTMSTMQKIRELAHRQLRRPVERLLVVEARREHRRRPRRGTAARARRASAR